MARVSTSRNLFGFGRKKVTTYKHRGSTRRDISSLAYKAGQRSGDTGQFSSWADSKKLKDNWDRDALREFEKSYRAGVEKGEAQERKIEEKREAKAEKREAKSKAKEELQEVQSDVIEALAGLGMSRTQAKTLARSKYRQGDSFGELFDRIMKRSPSLSNPESGSQLERKGWRLVDKFRTRETAAAVFQKYGPARLIYRSGKWEVWTRQAANPAKFDRCVSDVSKSLKKAGRPGNAYAICTAAGAKNPKRKKNPLESAKKAYTDFTGLPATEVTEVPGQTHRHSTVFKTGQLVCLDIITPEGKEIPLVASGFQLEPRRFLRRDLRHSHEAEQAEATWILDPSAKAKTVMVTFSEDGKQMMFTGGDQVIPLEALGFGERDMRDNMFIGTIIEITYRGRKKFEHDGKEEVDFHHEFGKQGSQGMLPLLGYYLRTKQMFSLGGRYKIAPVRSDIGASPGIVG
jgi:hypothetical protein